MSTQPSENSPHGHYPIFLDLRGRRVVVVGGGSVARRKVESLLDAGAQVCVIAPEVVPLPAGVEIHRRPFIPDDLADAMLVIAATNDRAVNRAIVEEADRRCCWVNVVDDPELCSFIVPAIVRRGALRIAISTGGASPVLAKRLKAELEAAYGAEYGELIEWLWQLRQTWEPRALAAGLPTEARREAWERVLALPLLDWLRAGDVPRATAAAQALLDDALSTVNTGCED